MEAWQLFHQSGLFLFLLWRQNKLNVLLELFSLLIYFIVTGRQYEINQISLQHLVISECQPQQVQILLHHLNFLGVVRSQSFTECKSFLRLDQPVPKIQLIHPPCLNLAVQNSNQILQPLVIGLDVVEIFQVLFRALGQTLDVFVSIFQVYLQQVFLCLEAACFCFLPNKSPLELIEGTPQSIYYCCFLINSALMLQYHIVVLLLFFLQLLNLLLQLLVLLLQSLVFDIGLFQQVLSLFKFGLTLFVEFSELFYLAGLLCYGGFHIFYLLFGKFVLHFPLFIYCSFKLFPEIFLHRLDTAILSCPPFKILQLFHHLSIQFDLKLSLLLCFLIFSKQVGKLDIKLLPMKFPTLAMMQTGSILNTVLISNLLATQTTKY